MSKNLSTTLRLAAALAVGIGSAQAAAQAPAPVPAPGASSTIGAFRFVGVTDPDVAPESWFSAQDNRLLLTLQQPMTPNQLLQAGVPFRASQIERLQRAGFLAQEGTTFRATLPMLDAERFSGVTEAVRAAAVEIVTTLRSDLAELNFTLSQEGYRSAFPAVVNWLLRERVWAELLQADMIDLGVLIENQRLASPARGWYGVLWYSPTADDPQIYVSARARDRAVVACWSATAATPVASLAPGGSANRFLASLKSDDRRVDDPERFPQLQAAGVIGSDGWLQVPTWEWTPDDPNSVAAVVDRLTSTLAVAIARGLPIAALAEHLGSHYEAEAATIGYVELVPMLVQAMIAAGFPMAVADNPDFSSNSGGSSGLSIPLRPQPSLPEISAVVWRRLRESGAAIPIHW